MSERSEDLHAPPADHAGHRGVFGRPDEDLSVDYEGIGGETDQDPSRGGDRGSWMPILIWLAVVLAVAAFVVYAHQA